MKRFLLALFFLWLHLHAFAESIVPNVIMRIPCDSIETVTLKVQVASPSSIFVDWGDGLRCEYSTLRSDLELAEEPKGHFVKIYSEQIVALQCKDCKIQELDVTQANQLQSLNCSGNLLEALDLSANKELRSLTCSNNQLAYLNLSNCQSLQELYLDNNKFTSIDLNRFFSSVPAKLGRSKDIDMRIEGNPGARKCNTGLVLYKNWTMDVEGDNSSAYPITISSLLEDGASVQLELRTKQSSVVLIDWGQGPVSVNISAKSTRVKGKIFQNQIKIWSEDLTYLKCERMMVCDIDVSSARNLQQIYLGHNELETVDLTNNKYLTRIGLNNNHLTDLDLTNNQKLSGLYIQENKLSSKVLNEIYKQLPARKKYEDKVNLRVVGNPGAEKTKYLDAVKKKWHPDMFDN